VEIGVLEVLETNGTIREWNDFLKKTIITARKVFSKIGTSLVVMMTAVDRWKSGVKRRLG